MLLSPAGHHPTAPSNSVPLPNRTQDKGLKFDAFFSTTLRDNTGRSRSVARDRDQKR
jgi:hypothetical protein